MVTSTVLSVSRKENPILQAQKNSGLYTNAASSSSSGKQSTLKNEPKKRPDDEKLQRDLRIIQMRNYLDPKRFYKNPDKGGKVIAVGTVIEGPSEYKSSRLTRKERKQSIVEEILSDQKTRQYTRRVFQEIQKERGNRKRFEKAKKGKKTNSKKIRALF